MADGVVPPPPWEAVPAPPWEASAAPPPPPWEVPPPPWEKASSITANAIAAVPGNTLGQKAAGLLFPIPGASLIAKAGETRIPILAPAVEYAKKSLANAEGYVAEKAGELGVPPWLAATIVTGGSLPSEVLASMVPETVAGAVVTAAVPYMKLPKSTFNIAPKGTPEQVASLAAAHRGVLRSAEVVERFGIGSGKVATPEEALAGFRPMDRLEVLKTEAGQPLRAAVEVKLSVPPALPAGALGPVVRNAPTQMGIPAAAAGEPLPAALSTPPLMVPQVQPPAVKTAAMSLELQKLKRSLNEQTLGLRDFKLRNSGALYKPGPAANLDEMRLGIENTKSKIAGLEAELRNPPIPERASEVSAAKAILEVPTLAAMTAEDQVALQARYTVLRKTVGPDMAGASLPRLAALPKADAERLVAEMASSAVGPNPIVKPITNAATASNLVNAVERMARPRMESEKILLGLDEINSVMRATAQDLLRMRAEGRPLSPQQASVATDAVIEGIKSGEFTPATGAEMLGYDISHTQGRLEFVKFLREASSGLGYGLSQVSIWQRAMAQAFGKDPALQSFFKQSKVLGGVVLEESPWDKAMELVRKEELLRRAGLISHPATAITNAVSQAEMSAANLYEDIISGALGAATGKVPFSSILDDAAADVMGFVSKLSPARQKEMSDLLSKFPMEQRRLLNTSSVDMLANGPYVKMLTFLNSWQDRFFATAGFDAYLRQTMARTGRTINQMTETDVRMAADHARRITYASAPRTDAMIQAQRKVAIKDYLNSTGKPKEAITDFDLETAVKYADKVVVPKEVIMDSIGGPLLQVYQKLPFLSALGPTFPRFMLNAMRRIQSLSPLPLLSPATYAAMANPDPRVAFKAVSQVATGMTYFGAGYALAEAGAWGDKLNEVRGWGGGQVNINKYAGTFAAPMLMGRLLHDYQKDKEFGLIQYTPEELFQVFTSLRRDDMAKVPLLDVIDDEASPKAKMQAVFRMLDSFQATLPPRLLGMFTRDISGVFRGEGAKQRYTRERNNPSDYINPIKDQIPLWSETLPEYRSPVREGAVYRGETTMERALRLAGVINKQKTPIESELDRLGVRPRTLWPRTGLEPWDREATIIMGKLASRGLDDLRNMDFYKLSDKKIKKLLMEERIKMLQGEAVAASMNTKERGVLQMLKSESALNEELLKREMKKRGVPVP